MKFPCVVLILTAAAFASCAPTEDGSEPKIRQKRKELPLVNELLESGIAKKRTARAEKPAEGLQPVKADSAVVATDPDAGLRVKKAPNVGPCGRTMCGPLVSAQGPGIKDLDTQRSSELAEQVYMPNPQARTYDLYNPVIGYGQSSGSISAFSAPAAVPVIPQSFGNSIFQSSVQPIHVEPAPYVPIHHPIVTSLSRRPVHDFNFNVQRLQDFYPLPSGFAETRRPVYISNQPFTELDESRQPLICQPYRGKFLSENLSEKSLNNATEVKAADDISAAKSANEDQITEHLRRVSDIRDEIVRLNHAAQKIMDQQENFARMQQAHMSSGEGAMARQYGRRPMYSGMGMGAFGGGMGGGMGASMSSSQAGASAMSSSQGSSMSSMGNHMPFPYMRASDGNAGNFPQGAEDMEFFMNMMHTLRKMSNMQQPVQDANQSGRPKFAEDVFSDLYRGYQQPYPQQPQQQQPQYQQPQQQTPAPQLPPTVPQQPPKTDSQKPSKQT